MLKIKKNTTFLYLFLFTGAFNDILRLGTTDLTLFRIMLPFAIVLTLFKSKKVRKLYLLTFGIAVVSFLQSLWFCEFNDIGIQFSTNRYILYLFYYICIVAVIGSVLLIYENDKCNFQKNFLKYIVIIGIGYLLIFMYIYLGNYSYSNTNIVINNYNDYGAMITAVLPVFYFISKNKGEFFFKIYIVTAIIFLILNDCKLALLGVIVQAAIIIYFEMGNRIGYRKWLIIPTILAVLFFVFVANSIDISLHGYTWKETIVEPIRLIIRGEMYAQSNTSVSFRVNIFVVSIHWILKTKLLGIGVGNSGLLLRNILGNYGLYDSWMNRNSVALHNVFMEILLEFGVIAVIGIVCIAKKVRFVLRKRKLEQIEICFIAVIISSILWGMAPSRITTDYQIIAILSFLLLSVSKCSVPSLNTNLKIK